MNVQVMRVPPDRTYALRQRILRSHESIDKLVLPGDDDPDTGHYAAVDDAGEVVCTVRVARQPPPWNAGEPDAWQLKGMATTEAMRGKGIGAQVLDAAIDHVARHGGRYLWCNARTPAISFYERGGFTTRGEKWDDPDVGPHIAMWRYVDPADAGAGDANTTQSSSS